MTRRDAGPGRTGQDVPAAAPMTATAQPAIASLREMPEAP
jgi:hypothetical protein